MLSFGKKESDYLYSTRVTFENINKNAAIAAELEKVSYDAVRIQEGLVIHNQIEELFRLIVIKRKKRNSVSKKVKSLYYTVNREYAGHVNRLRKELVGNPEILEELGLTGQRKRDVSGFIEQSTQFYTTAIAEAEVAAEILPFGFTAEMLTASRDAFLQYQSKRNQYEKIKGELQKLVEEKNKAFKRLKVWMAALIAAAKVAFADNLQTLEEIGLFMRNSPKPKSKETNQAPGDKDPPVVDPVEPPEPVVNTHPVIAA